MNQLRASVAADFGEHFRRFGDFFSFGLFLQRNAVLDFFYARHFLSNLSCLFLLVRGVDEPAELDRVAIHSNIHLIEFILAVVSQRGLYPAAERFVIDVFSGGAFWRVAILLATLFCVAMLFAPLVREMVQRLGGLWEGLP